MAKIREQELHDKGVKCIDMNSKVILTGSYDATLKVRNSMPDQNDIVFCVQVWRKECLDCVKVTTEIHSQL